MNTARLRFAATALALLTLCCGSNLGSIGAMLGKHHTTGRVTVKDAPPDMEAARAGLLPGDEILTIDGRDVRHMTAEQIHDALVGLVGTHIDLTVLRGEEVLRLRVRRGPLK